MRCSGSSRASSAATGSTSASSSSAARWTTSRRKTALDETRALALWPSLDLETVRAHLAALERIAAGDPAGGPIARLDTTARFHWLAAPSSTIIETSEVHTGICGDPAAELEKLFRELVEP
jgi:hypothetical protein